MLSNIKAVGITKAELCILKIKELDAQLYKIPFTNLVTDI